MGASLLPNLLKALWEEQGDDEIDGDEAGNDSAD